MLRNPQRGLEAPKRGGLTFRLILMLATLSGVIIALSACATPGREDSDLPWNTPQPWETAPQIPGLTAP